MRLTSKALQDGQIPVRYSKDGRNVSPPLAWSDLPAGTKELALLFENITPQTRSRSCSGWYIGSRRIRAACPRATSTKPIPRTRSTCCTAAIRSATSATTAPRHPRPDHPLSLPAARAGPAAGAAPRPRQGGVPRSRFRACPRAERSDHHLRAPPVTLSGCEQTRRFGAGVACDRRDARYLRAAPSLRLRMVRRWALPNREAWR